MELPDDVPVMTLPNVILFPQALLPLYIFEPRYRRMLEDVLGADRMFCVAMQRPDRVREAPADVAGLGLVRACVKNKDGTSHLILQGLVRVELVETVQRTPYRREQIRAFKPASADSVVVDALLARLRELVAERLAQGSDLGLPVLKQPAPVPDADGAPLAVFSSKNFVGYLDQIEEPEQVVDVVSCALLAGTVERQKMLETVDLESRLKKLIQFLLSEIRRARKAPGP